MKNNNKILAKIMLAGALGFSFAAEAANYTLHTPAIPVAVAIAQDDNSVKQWQQELLGEYADVSKLTAENLRQAYITLLESARAKQANWSDQEWKKVHAVINQLDARKNVVEKQLGADDKAKIKLLQGELRALETKGDIKD
ncbi:hypothetical protein [Pontibacter sp. HJ8]